MPNRTPKLRDQARSIFFSSLASALRSGHETRAALELLGEDDLDASVARVARTLAGHASEGKPLSEAMAQMPRTFDPATMGIVRDGEASGKLADALELVGADSDRLADLRPRLWLAFIFPGFALGAALFAFIVLMLFVLPAFKEVFVSFGADLPAMTLAYIGLFDFLARFWYLVIGIPAVAILAFTLRSKHPYGRQLDRLLLSLPPGGRQMLRVHAARMAGLLADTVRTGFDIRATLAYLRDSSGNRGLADQADALRNEAASAPDVATWLAQSRSVPRRLSIAGRIQSGPERLAAALADAAGQYAEAARISAGRIERNGFILAYVLAGLIVGTMVIAMYLPIFKMGSVV